MCCGRPVGEASHARQDVVGRFGPDDRLRVFIVPVEKLLNDTLDPVRPCSLVSQASGLSYLYRRNCLTT